MHEKSCVWQKMCLPQAVELLFSSHRNDFPKYSKTDNISFGFCLTGYDS